jgi:hypothetical protein
MAPADVDSLVKALTDLRVDAAARLARIETQLAEFSGMRAELRALEQRVDSHEARLDRVGWFTWGDVIRAAGLLAVAVSVAFTLTHW